MIDLYEELTDAFGVTIKELKEMGHNVEALGKSSGGEDRRR